METFAKWVLGAIAVIVIALTLYLVVPGLGGGAVLRQFRQPLPDLVITDLRVQYHSTGRSARATVKNVGNAVAPSVGVEYFLAEERLQSQQFTPDLQPGESFTVAASSIIPTDEIGNRKFRAIVDFYNNIAERREHNNERIEESNVSQPSTAPR